MTCPSDLSQEDDGIHHANPCGKVFTHEELQTIAGIVMRYDGYVITDQKTTNSVKYHHYAIVQLQKNVYLCRQNSTK